MRLQRSPLACGLILFLLVHYLPACTAQEIDPVLSKLVDQLAAKLGFDADGPGVAISVEQPGKLHFIKTYGRATLGGEPITSKTMFELASLSKPFTATAVLLLQERDLLAITDDVRKYLPELPEYDAAHPIHLRDLLQHTSGLPEYLQWTDAPQGKKGYVDNNDFLPLFASRRKKFPLRFLPGEKYDYCNSNYMLLAMVIQRVSGKSYGRFMHDEIFVPAGMKNTFVYELRESVPAKTTGLVNATGYEWDPIARHWSATWGTPPARLETNLAVGDGGIWSNLEDLAAWDASVRAEKILQPASWKLSRERSKTRDGKTSQYALGWVMYGPERAPYGFGHDGEWGGFRTFYYQYTARNRTTIILSNRGNFDPDTLWYPLNDLIEKAK